MRSVEWDDGDILVIDQTLLPFEEEVVRLSDAQQVADAIKRLRVRGAPAIGIAGAMGVAQAARRPSGSIAELLAHVETVGAMLKATRPTAVNLAWAIDRVLAAARSAGATNEDIAEATRREALAIQEEDAAACVAMAEHAQEFFRDDGVVLTHCNTGFLCTGGIGTALGAIRVAHEHGRGIAVLASETRPLLQGARLTAWELTRLGIPNAVIVDGAAAGMMARGDISLVIVGADRIAANGDTANKVGTYMHALAAKAAGVPFVVVAPTSTVDLSVPDGAGIEIEERDAAEVTTVLGALRISTDGVNAVNPAFDVTPSDLITAIVTERGVVRPPFGPNLRENLRDAAALPGA